MTDELHCPRCASTRVHAPNAFDRGASDLCLADRRQMGPASCDECGWSQEAEAPRAVLGLLERMFFDALDTGPMREACSSCGWLAEVDQHVEEDRCPDCGCEGSMTGYYGDPTVEIREGDLAEGWAWRWLAPLRAVLASVDGRETIATAAIRVDGEVWTLPRPARHDTVIKAWAWANRVDDVTWHEQGFVTSRGRFVGRDEAGELALAAGQVDRAGLHLCTEDLW